MKAFSKKVSALGVAAVMSIGLMTQNVSAVTMSVTTTAPMIDDADIAQTAGLTDPGGNIGHVWSNRPIQGQSFTTGSNPLGYLLNSVSMLARVDQAQTTSPNWTVRVGTLDGGSNFNTVASENGAGVTIPNGGPGKTNPANWVTWTFDAPILLNANTLYAFDVDSSGSGFISMNNPGDVYGGGTAFSSGSGGNPANPVTQHNFDRVFHVDLVALPEPATATIALMGLSGLMLRRRKA